MLVTCANFYDPVEAQVVRARLEAEGIPATVADDHMIHANRPLSVALGGAKLQVPEECLADALLVMENYFSGAFSADVDAETGTEPLKCPKCLGSSIKRSVPASQKALAIGVYLASGATVSTRESLFQCQDCALEWHDAA